MMMKRTLKNEEKQIYIRQGSAGIQRQTGEGLVGKQDLHVVLLLLLRRLFEEEAELPRIARAAHGHESHGARTHQIWGCPPGSPA